MISSAWASMPISALYRRRVETGRSDLPLLSVYRDYGVVARDGRTDNFNKASEDLSTYQVVRPQDLVLNKMKTWQGSLGVSSLHGIVSPAYIVCEQVGNVEPRFAHHLLRSQPLIAEYGARSKGIRPAQWDLAWDEFRTIKINVPPIARQRAIADFLDAETEKIDELADALQRMSALLIERFHFYSRQQATIGPSMPLRRVSSSLQTGGTPPTDHTEYFTDATVDWYSPGDFGDLLELRPPARLISERAIADGRVPPLLADSTLLVGIGATAGRVAYLDHPGTSNQQITCIRTNDRMRNRYLAWQLWARTDEVRATAPYTTLPIITNEFIAGLILAVPDLPTQDTAVRRLDAGASTLKSIYRSLDAQISRLKERRHALITAAVTGQISIPGAT